jgi:hypothetical protein
MNTIRADRTLKALGLCQVSGWTALQAVAQVSLKRGVGAEAGDIIAVKETQSVSVRNLINQHIAHRLAVALGNDSVHAGGPAWAEVRRRGTLRYSSDCDN